MLQSLFQLKGRDKITPAEVARIDAYELNERLNNDLSSIVLLDVRTPGEFQYDGRIAGSRLIPLHMLTQRINELAKDKDKTIVCVCRSGHRSHTACEILAAAGFPDVINLSGGMIGWKHARLPYQ